MLRTLITFVLVVGNVVTGETSSIMREMRKISSLGEAVRRQQVEVDEIPLQGVMEMVDLKEAGIPTTAPIVHDAPIYYSPSAPEFKRANFEMQCRDTLLSGDATWDELISQNDYAAFLTEYCISESTCSPDESLQFQTLPTSLQHAFTDPICSEDDTCDVTGEQDFGYVYNKDTEEVVEIQIKDICDSLFPLLGSLVAPTSAPSAGLHQPMAPVFEPPESPVFEEPKAPVFESPKSPVYGGPLNTKTPTMSPDSPVFMVETNEPSLAPVAEPEAPAFEPPKSPVYGGPLSTKNPTKSPGSPVFMVETIEPSLAPVGDPLPSELPTTAPADSAKPTTVPGTASPLSPAPTASLTTGAPTRDPTTAASVTASPVIVTTSPSAAPVVVTTSPPTRPDIVTTSPSTSPVVVTTNPSASPVVVTTNPSASPVVVTTIPSLSPSSMPSTAPAIVFINEVGTADGMDFVEVVYSSELGVGITNYSVYLYSYEGGLVLDMKYLPEGNFSANRMTFTFVTFPPSSTSSAAIALVNEEQEVVSFLSRGRTVVATEGPAAGIESTDIMALTGGNARRKLQEGGMSRTSDSSWSLVGTGCRFDEFAVAETIPTPGSMNVGQEILGCRSEIATLSPSSSPSLRIGGSNGISVGAIVGISVSLGFLFLIMLSLMRGGNEPKAVFEEETLVFDELKKELNIADADDFMADTGDIEEDIPNPIADTVPPRSDSSWWNAVYWMGSATGPDGSKGDTSKSGIATPEVMDSPEEEVDLDDEGDEVVTAAAVEPHAEPKTTTSRGWFFRRRERRVSQPSDEEDVDSTHEVNVSSVDPPLSPGDDDMDENAVPLTDTEGTSKTLKSVNFAEPEENHLVVAAAVGGAVVSRKRRKKRIWLGRRGEKKMPQHPKEEIVKSSEATVPVVAPPQIQTIDASSIALSRKDDDSEMDEIPLTPAQGSSEASSPDVQASSVEAGVAPAEVVLVTGAAIGVASATKKKKRGWLFQRNAAPAPPPSDDEQILSDDIRYTPDVGAPQATPSTQQTVDAASLALSMDYESDVDTMSLKSAEVTSDALDNLDDALGKHDWNAIYNIAKKVGKKGDPHTDTFKSLTSADHVPASDVASDYGSALSDLENSPAIEPIDTSVPEGELTKPEGGAKAADPSSAGWVGYFRRKKSTKGESDVTSSYGVARKSADDPSPGDASHGEDVVAAALAKSRPAKAANFEAFERERQQTPVATGSRMQPPKVEDETSSVAESIQKISSELENQVEGTVSLSSFDPYLIDSATEAEIAKLIDSKDWEGLGDFSAQEEVVNERELQSIEARSTNPESEDLVLARLRAQRELEAAMVAFGSKGNDEEPVDEEAKKDDAGGH